MATADDTNPDWATFSDAAISDSIIEHNRSFFWLNYDDPNTAVIEFTNLDPDKRPLGAAADGYEVTNAAWVQVTEDRARPVTVLFDPGHSLEDRVFSEQFAY